MDILTFINSLTNKDLNRIRNSKSDAEARRLLREYQALQLRQAYVICSYSEKDVDNAYNKGFKDAMLKYRTDL